MRKSTNISDPIPGRQWRKHRLMSIRPSFDTRDIAIQSSFLVAWTDSSCAVIINIMCGGKLIRKFIDSLLGKSSLQILPVVSICMCACPFHFAINVCSKVTKIVTISLIWTRTLPVEWRKSRSSTH